MTQKSRALTSRLKQDTEKTDRIQALEVHTADLGQYKVKLSAALEELTRLRDREERMKLT